MSKPWTDEDIQFLRDNIATMTHQEIADKLGRTKSAIVGKCEVHKIRKNKKPPKIGDVFNKLTVIGKPFYQRGGAWVRCRCECGRETDISANVLRAGQQGCGECRKAKSKIEVGQEFGRLTIINIPESGDRVDCECSCGNKYTNRAVFILKGDVVSCGCYVKESCHIKFGKDAARFKHGFARHPLYKIWNNLIQRNESVCESWKQFDVFYEWAIKLWSDGLELIQIDHEKEYSESNCKFGSKEEHQKYIDEKRADRNIKKHGHKAAATPETRRKREETCVKRYGVRVPLQSKEIMAKLEKTNLEKYGAKSAMGNKDVRDKGANTRLAKYGRLYGGCRPTKNEESGIREWLNSFGLNFLPDSSLLGGKEIDMYDESLKLGIEYCGLHWHHEMSPSPRLRKYHHDKYRILKESGVRLITIFSDEWRSRKEQVKNFLLSTIGKNQTRIFARKCEVAEIDHVTGMNFINNNHIQNISKRSMKYFGLTYENQLVGLMSFGKHPRDNNQITLDRMCFIGGTTVIGGASKMFSLALKWAKEAGHKKIVSWSDNRWSVGGVYEQLGFVCEKELGPDYAYVTIKNPSKRIPKQSMKKSAIDCPDDISERDFLAASGFARIWDCGKKRFVYEIK